MHKNGIPSPILPEINRVAIFVSVSHINDFVALEKAYRMSYMRTLVIFVFERKYSMKDKIR
jgi:hypothetical protein